MPNDPAETLRKCGLFRWLNPPSLEKVAAMSRVRNFAAGERIFEQDSDCPGLFVVDEGLVRVYRLAPDGREHVLHMVDPGGTFAEVAAIANFRVPACAEALRASRCLMIPAVPLRAALEQDHQLCLQLLQGMALWVRHLVGLLEDITLRDAAGRVARHLLERGDANNGDIPLPRIKRHLASHLNLTSETLSRTLRKLIDEGAVENWNKTDLRIADRALLAAIANGQFPGL